MAGKIVLERVQNDTGPDEGFTITRGKVHLVSTGDTLGSIAVLYGMTDEDLAAMNPELIGTTLVLGTEVNVRTVVDLTGYTVRLAIRSKKTGTITNTGHQTLTITDAVNGRCQYTFQAGDLPDSRGGYECDLELTNAGGQRETLFNKVEIKTRAEIAT